MKQKITSLTPEQKAQMQVYVDKWLAIGLDTRPADRVAAEAGINRAYTLAGLTPPQQIVWVQSPLSGVLSIVILKATVRATVWDTVRDTVGATVWATVGATVWATVRDTVRATVRATVWDTVRDTVRATVGATVRDTVWATVWDTVGATVGATVYGQHDAHWLAFYDYFREVCDLTTETDLLQGLSQVAQNANWWWPYENICFVSERPNIVSFDTQNRLHSDNGAAIAYPDGFSIYAIHGVRVTEQIVLSPETLTIEQIDNETNAEVRRVMLDRFGYDRFMVESGTTAIHSDKYGILYRRNIRNDEPLVMVSVLNSTPEPDGTFKRYMLRVPPTVRTAHEAVAWTFELTVDEYQPLAES